MHIRKNIFLLITLSFIIRLVSIYLFHDTRIDNEWGILLNNLIKFIELRTHDGAQWEIQKVAHACLTIAENLWPIAVQSYREIRGLEL